MKLRSTYEFALAAPTSMGVRLTPEGRSAVQVSDHFLLQATSAETNVMNVASSLGMSCVALTRFVKGSPVAAFIKRSLRSRGIRYMGPEIDQGGPWGYRHQFNIADAGCGLRAPRVWNDRTGELGQTLIASDYKPEELFGRRGVGILHISGLIAALSAATGQACLELARAARKYGTLVSFDLNFRASFWQGRKQELKEIFQAIAAEADILTSIDVIEGTPDDFQPMPLEEKAERFKRIISRAQCKYPKAQMFMMSLRETINAEEHRLGALLWDGEWKEIFPQYIPVRDRIGGGDALVGGVLYGLLQGWTSEQALQFGWASAVMASESEKDYAEPADEKQVWDIYHGNALVQR